MAGDVDRSCAERALTFWATVSLALGGKSSVERYGDEIVNCAEKYLRERRVGLKNKARDKKLERIVDICDELIAAVSDSRDWLDHHLDPALWEAADVSSIIQNEEHSPLRALRSAIEAARERTPGYSLKENVYFRRRFWIGLAIIYEESTDRRVATSKNKDGDIQGNFVRFVTCVSELIGPEENVTSDIIDQFVDWYRSSDSSDMRDEIVEFRMLAAAVGPVG